MIFLCQTGSILFSGFKKPARKAPSRGPDRHCGAPGDGGIPGTHSSTYFGVLITPVNPPFFEAMICRRLQGEPSVSSYKFDCDYKWFTTGRDLLPGGYTMSKNGVASESNLHFRKKCSVDILTTVNDISSSVFVGSTSFAPRGPSQNLVNSGVIILPTQTSCTITGEIPQNYRTFVLFDPPKNWQFNDPWNSFVWPGSAS